MMNLKVKAHCLKLYNKNMSEYNSFVIPERVESNGRV